jgi:hypothetical protein
MAALPSGQSSAAGSVAFSLIVCRSTCFSDQVPAVGALASLFDAFTTVVKAIIMRQYRMKRQRESEIAMGEGRGIPFHIQRATSHQVAFDLVTSAYIPGTHEWADYSLVTFTGNDIVILQRSFLYEGPTFSLDGSDAQAASSVGELQR